MVKISVVIPTFNEQKDISDCLSSLDKQSLKEFEVIVVDDGSTDKTLKILHYLKFKNFSLRLLKQKHKGPGMARNLGAEKARGEILVFVDADMTFDKEFLKKLIQPVKEREALGTFSKEELVLNKNKVWSKCWNINKNLPFNKMHPDDYPDEQNVFRAILKKEFLRVGGFESVGYVDDHTLFEKLGYKAKVAEGAIFYHKNPESLGEVFRQARWIGKSEFKRRKIKNENLMRFITLLRFNFFLSLIKGVFNSVKCMMPQFLLFKIVYDFGIEVSVIKSFFGEQKYR